MSNCMLALLKGSSQYLTMYADPSASEDKIKLQEEMAYGTLKFAGMIAGALWVAPIIYHFVQKQF